MEAEAEQDLLLMADLAEVGVTLHFQVVQETQEVTVHPKETTEELHVTQLVMEAAVAEALAELVLQVQVNQALQVDHQYQIQYPDHRLLMQVAAEAVAQDQEVQVAQALVAAEALVTEEVTAQAVELVVIQALVAAVDPIWQTQVDQVDLEELFLEHLVMLPLL